MKKTEITTFLKKNKKQVLITLGVIMVVVAIWLIIKLIRKGTKKTMVETMTGQTVTPGLNFALLAGRLQYAFTAVPFHTDEDTVYSVLEQMNNNADWQYLQLMYREHWGNMPLYEKIVHGIAAMSDNGDLIHDLTAELDSGELERCRVILSSKGINPGF